LQLGDKYPAIKDFKKWVIEPAVTQINEHSDLKLSYGQRKTGRVVTHLLFSFSPKQPQNPKPAKTEKTGALSDEYVSKHALPGESWEQARHRLSSRTTTE
jgi:plasmid replication initiation protein